jgi:hypothetical protein
MFGSKKLIETVERLLKNHTWQQADRIRGLEREVEDMRTWNGKVRDKNSALRRERRRLRTLLDDHNIPWKQGT